MSRRFMGAWKCVCCTTAFFLLPSCGRFLLILFQKRRCFCLCHCSRFNFCISIVFKGIEQFFLCIKWAYTLVGIPIKDECLILLRLCVIGHRKEQLIVT